MLHSLAHMLLTRISLDCGYPAAALRERIYALPDTRMYGILIHTGTSGSEGGSANFTEAAQLRNIELGIVAEFHLKPCTPR